METETSMETPDNVYMDPPDSAEYHQPDTVQSHGEYNESYPPAPAYTPKSQYYPPQSGEYNNDWSPPPPSPPPPNHPVTHRPPQVPNRPPSQPFRPPVPSRPSQDVVDSHFRQQPNVPPNHGVEHQHSVAMETTSVSHEQQNGGSCAFTEKSIRLGFIKKVFAILFCQLLFTAGIVCLLLFVKPIKRYLIYHNWVYITSICLTIVLLAVFGFLTKLRRLWPWNMVFLFIITFVMSVTLGSIASSMDTDEVLMAVGIVAAVVLVCAILGLQRKFDFTPLVGFVTMFGMCVSAFGFLNIFFYNRVVSVVYASLGALVFSMWLLLDIQLILKGKHKLGLDPEEYVSGALYFYVDIVYILYMVFSIFRNT